jgi:hypothetical protein
MITQKSLPIYGSISGLENELSQASSSAPPTATTSTTTTTTTSTTTSTTTTNLVKKQMSMVVDDAGKADDDIFETSDKFDIFAIVDMYTVILIPSSYMHTHIHIL